MRLTLFSVEEANQLIGELRPALEKLVQTKRELDAGLRGMAALTLAVQGAAPTNPDELELRRLAARQAELTAQLTQGVRSIQRRGCIVKDLDRGLLDFYTVSGDRLIFLCWQLGETEVAHWHTLEGGFSGRQPLNRAEHE